MGLLILFGVLGPNTAYGERGELGAMLGPLYSVATVDGDRVSGLGSSLSLTLGLSDSFRGALSAGLSQQFRGEQKGGGFSAGWSALSMQYIVDVITWVPYLTAGLELLWMDESRITALQAGLGLDYRNWRHYALGGQLLYHGMVSGEDITGSQFPTYMSLGLYIRYIFNPI